MKLRANNDYKCFMITPNINWWYNRDIHIFIGWFFWGFDIVIKEPKTRFPSFEESQGERHPYQDIALNG